MILKGISVDQNPPTKDYLWITPKGNTRFWNQSTWSSITGHQDASEKLNTNGDNATTEFWNLVMSKIETELGLSIDDSGYLHSINGFYSDNFVSALGANSNSGGGSGGGSGGLDETTLWQELTNNPQWTLEDDKIINKTYLDLSEYYTKDEADDTFVKIEWFNKLFNLYDNSTVPPTLISPNTSFTATDNFNLKSLVGFWTEKYISALGLNTSGGSGGGGGIDITDLLNILNGTTDISEYTESKTIATAFLGNALTSLTKSMVESVLTGNITSHVHNQYQTVLTGLVTSHTHSTLAFTHTNEINFTNTPTSGNLHNFWFNYRDGDTDAMNPNNLITDYFFGNRNGVANARLNAGLVKLSGGAFVGGELTVGTELTPLTSTRAQLSMVSATDNPCDLWLGTGGERRWSINCRNSAENYRLSISYYATGTHHVGLLPNGNVGIGTKAPAHKLTVEGDIIASSTIGISQTAGSGIGISLYGVPPTSGLPNYGLAFATTANFGKFGDVQGEWATYFTMNTVYGTRRGWVFRNATASTSLNVASISSEGNFCAYGGVTALATASSDKRLKEKVKPFNAKQIIDKLSPVEFEWNKKANKYNSNLELNKKNYGLIAQDSDGIIDNLVFDLPDGKGYKGIHYEKLTPILLQAVKEQQAEIDNLKKELSELKDIVKQLIEK